MSAKIKLNLDPDTPLTFEREVTIPTPSGKALKVVWTFKHRTTDELAALYQKWVDKARAEDEAAKARATASEGTSDPVPVPDLLDNVRATQRRDVADILDIASGWNLDGYAFDETNVAKFVALYKAAGDVLREDYRVSMTEGRLGN